LVGDDTDNVFDLDDTFDAVVGSGNDEFKDDGDGDDADELDDLNDGNGDHDDELDDLNDGDGDDNADEIDILIKEQKISKCLIASALINIASYCFNASPDKQKL